MRKWRTRTAVLLSLMLIAGMIVPLLTVSASAETIGRLLGDVDNEGVVTVLDATKIQKSLASLLTLDEDSEEAADVDGDHVVSILDATAIQKWLASISVPYAIGEPMQSEDSTDATSATEEGETTAPTQTETTGDEWKENTGTITLSDSGITVTGDGAYVTGNIVIITEGGDWEVTGSCSDGMIYVNTGEEKDVNDKVKLRLNGMSLTSTSGPAIYYDRCKRAFITIESGTENTVTDASSYTLQGDYTVGGVTYTIDTTGAKGAIHSDDTLEIKGKGKLTVNGSYKHGVCSDDDILIENGVLDITSVKDGMHANDDITMNGKNIEITIHASSDGVDSEGTVNMTLVKSLSITAEGKGVKAELDMIFTDGSYIIDTTDDCINGNSAVTLLGGSYTLETDDDAANALTTLTAENVTFTANAIGQGLKAGEQLSVNSGVYEITSTGDALHCDGNIAIEGGDFTITSGDDGMHADSTLSISGGNILVSRSNEGLEGNDVIISGGVMKVTASDDGVNAAGGNDNSSTGTFRPGQGSSSSNSSITVSGGYLYVVASGDGIDSNGSLSFNGGTVIVQGPASGGNSPIDADGTVGYNGGTVIALASASAMWQDLNGKLGNAVYNANIGSVQKGSVICVTDSSGNLLSALKSELSGNLGIVYYTDRTSTMSAVKFIRGGSYSGTLDDYGYSESGSVSGGTSYTASTSSGGWNPGGPGGRP